MLFRILFLCLLAISASLAPLASASAQDLPAPKVIKRDIPTMEYQAPQSLIETDSPLYLTPDKSEIIDLDTDVGSVIIGNDQHVNVLVDSARRLIFVPRQPGASHVTILGANGHVIMQRHVIVSGPKESYIRIRKTCALSGESDCQEVETYYCPDGCHRINNPPEEQAAEQETLDESLGNSQF